MLDLGTRLTIGGAPPPIVSPLPGPVMHHVDCVFRRYVVLQQGRAARVLLGPPKFSM